MKIEGHMLYVLWSAGCQHQLNPGGIKLLGFYAIQEAVDNEVLLGIESSLTWTWLMSALDLEEKFTNITKTS